MFPILWLCSKRHSVLGLGLILMMPAIRTTKSNLAWQWGTTNSTYVRLDGESQKKVSSLDAQPPHLQFILWSFWWSPESCSKKLKVSASHLVPSWSTKVSPNRLRLHEEVAIHLCLSAQLHQLCCTVGVLLAPKTLGLAFASKDPFPKCPDNKKIANIGKASSALWVKWNIHEEWFINNAAITSEYPTWTLQVHKVVCYQAVLLVGRSPLLQLSTFFLFKLLQDGSKSCTEDSVCWIWVKNLGQKSNTKQKQTDDLCSWAHSN